MSHTRVLPNVNIEYLDAIFLDKTGRMKLLDAATICQYPYVHLWLWMQRRGRYGLPTRELVDFLKEKIAGRRVIEIGAGMGDLGFHLGVTMTDSHIQTLPEMRMLYKLQGAEPIAPPSDVEK